MVLVKTDHGGPREGPELPWPTAQLISPTAGHCLLQVHQGIKGLVLDENSTNLTGAVISVTGINHDVTSGR